MENFMSNWCDNKLTVTGPNRRAVLATVAGATDKGEQVIFSMAALTKRVKELGIPIPTLGEGVRSPECPMGSVYVYNQHHEATDDSDILYFQTQWVEALATTRNLRKLSEETGCISTRAQHDVLRKLDSEDFAAVADALVE
jgi:hypothetical protein